MLTACATNSSGFVTHSSPERVLYAPWANVRCAQMHSRVKTQITEQILSLWPRGLLVLLVLLALALVLSLRVKGFVGVSMSSVTVILTLPLSSPPPSATATPAKLRIEVVFSKLHPELRGLLGDLG